MDHSVHSDVNTASREIEERLLVYEDEQEEERTLQPPAESPPLPEDDPSRGPVIKEIIKTPPQRLRLMLNEAQARSVKHPLESQLQILAGPGTGKTKTLISRVMYLLSQNVHPSDMIITTFTVKAANEMRERLAEMIGPSVANRLILGTFHSISRKYLHKYGLMVGVPTGFTIADDADSLHYVRDLCGDHGFKEDRKEARRIRDLISKAKASGFLPDSPGVTTVIKDSELELYKKYQEKLRDSKTLDFDDLLLKCAELLRRFPNVVSNIQAVLVDEYQDTNTVQYDLMKLFAVARENITIVGDPDQSIYGFRAALTTNLGRMVDDFPRTTVISLEENYRSSGHILNAALAVIQQDTERINKLVLPNHDMGAMPAYISVLDATAEARLIAEEVERLMTLSCGILKPADFVVLVRTGMVMKPIEAALTRLGIDYRVVGGSRFWDREEIKLVLSYLHLIKNRRSPSMVNIINAPRRGIGSTTMVALLGHANAHGVPLWDAVVLATKGELKVTKKQRETLTAFVKLIEECEELMNPKNRIDQPLVNMAKYLLEKLDYKSVLMRRHPETWSTRWENVRDLLSQMEDFEQLPPDPDLPDVPGVKGRTSAPEDVLGRYLATVNLAPTETEVHEVNPNMIMTISTIHSAKGLEWPVVFIPSVCEGHIPHKRAQEDELDEERRLLYVAMTRAKGLLYLTHPKLNTGIRGMDEKGSVVSQESQFMTPEAVACFRDRLPTMSYPEMKSLARTLGRECPDQKVFSKAKVQCEDSRRKAEAEGRWQTVEDEREVLSHHAREYSGRYGEYDEYDEYEYSYYATSSKLERRWDEFDDDEDFYAQDSKRRRQVSAGGNVKLSTSFAGHRRATSAGSRAVTDAALQQHQPQPPQPNVLASSFISASRAVDAGIFDMGSTSASEAGCGDGGDGGGVGAGRKQVMAFDVVSGDMERPVRLVEGGRERKRRVTSEGVGFSSLAVAEAARRKIAGRRYFPSAAPSAPATIAANPEPQPQTQTPKEKEKEKQKQKQTEPQKVTTRKRTVSADGHQKSLSAFLKAGGGVKKEQQSMLKSVQQTRLSFVMSKTTKTEKGIEKEGEEKESGFVFLSSSSP